MTKYLKRIYTVPVFVSLGRLLFSMARIRWLESASLGLARAYAKTVLRVQGRRRHGSAAEIAEEWNRLMPKPRSAFPVLKVVDDTAYAEIRIHCPLRGSGDAEACWRAMEFDRALLRAVGGQLVVMESQSVSGEPCCKLAIRPEGAAMADLPVAHPRWRET